MEKDGINFNLVDFLLSQAQKNIITDFDLLKSGGVVIMVGEIQYRFSEEEVQRETFPEDMPGHFNAFLFSSFVEASKKALRGELSKSLTQSEFLNLGEIEKIIHFKERRSKGFFNNKTWLSNVFYFLEGEKDRFDLSLDKDIRYFSIRFKQNSNYKNFLNYA